MSCSPVAHRSVSHMDAVPESVSLDAGLQTGECDELGHIQEGNGVHFDLMEEFEDLVSAL